MKVTIFMGMTLSSLLIISCQKNENQTERAEEERTKAKKELKVRETTGYTSEEAVTKSDRPVQEKASPLERAQQGDFSAFFTDEMVTSMKKSLQSRWDRKIAELDKLLNLTDEQKAELNAALEKQTGKADELITRLQNGEDFSEIRNELRGLRRGDIDPLSGLDDLLTEEQRAIYKADEEKKAARAKEANAYRALADIQTSVDMSEEQKDAVFNIFHEGAYKKNISVSSSDSGNFMETQVERRKQENENLINELRPVLSADQLETYQAELENQVIRMEQRSQMTRGFMERFRQRGDSPRPGAR